MAKITDFHFSSANGSTSIHCRMWSPETEPRGVVQIVHGISEHIGRYHDFACFLAENGFIAAGDDHLGHGLSVSGESDLGWIAEKDGWDLIIRDEKTLRDRLREEYPGLPMILLGHSMGSFMARTYIGLYPDDFDMCILSGTGHTPQLFCRAGRMIAQREIRRHGGRFRSRLLLQIAFGSYLRGIKDPIGPFDWICRDENVIREYMRDPLCGADATAELIYELLVGLEMIAGSKHMQKMKKDLPILFISGMEDPVGSCGREVRTVFKRFRSIGMRDVTIKLYPEDRHEVLNELNKQEVYADVLAWIEKRLK